MLARLRYRLQVVADTLGKADGPLRAINGALQDTEGMEPVSGYLISNVDLAETLELPILEGDEQYWQVGTFWDLTVSEGV